MPDYLEADVAFPDGNTYLYSIPTIKIADYTIAISELFQVLLNEYEEIRVNLEKELTETGKSELYTDLTKLIVKIADYIFSKEEDVRKGIGEIMGGKVLELESERL